MGRCLYPDEVPLLFLPRPFISLRSNSRKPPRYRSASLDNEPVTTMLSSDNMDDVDEEEESQMKRDVSTQTDINMNQVEKLV